MTNGGCLTGIDFSKLDNKPVVAEKPNNIDLSPFVRAGVEHLEAEARRAEEEAIAEDQRQRLEIQFRTYFRPELPNRKTQERYRDAFGLWQQYCSRHGWSPKPAYPALVATFLADMLDAGATYSEMKILSAAISFAHSIYELPSPISDPLVRAVLHKARKLMRGN